MFEIERNKIDGEFPEENLDKSMLGFSNTFPHLKDYFEEHQTDVARSLTGQEVTDYSDSEKPCIIVETGAAGIVRENQEAMTPGLKGCVAVYIEVPGYEALAHFTPGSSLGYRHTNAAYPAERAVRSAVEKLIRPLKEKVSLQDGVAIIIANEADESYTPKANAWHYERVKPDWDRLKAILEEQGLRVKVVEVPVNHSAVYSTPQQPGRLYVIGNKTHVDEVTGALVTESGVADFWISTDPSVQEKLVEHKIYQPTQSQQAEPSSSSAESKNEELAPVRRRLLDL